MWRNFFSVALRNLGKNKIFSFINVSGLAIGLASAILIILFVLKEVSYDRFNVNSDRIYRAYIDGNIGERSFRGAWTSYPLAPSVAREIPEIEDFVRLEVYEQQFVWSGLSKGLEDNVIFADSSFFRIFSIDLLYGNPDSVLTRPGSVVLTRTKALQYFGRENVIGETLEFNSMENFYTITGVMEEFPDNSHFFADFLVSMSTSDASRGNEWLVNSIYSYLLLSKGADFRDVELKMNQILLSNVRRELKDILGISPEEWVRGGNAFGVFLQPLPNIHLNPDIEYGEENCYRPVNDRTYIYIFSLIAFFILVIASINFMNLSTARSSIRAREIAMRKVVGSGRSLLVIQFLVESLILSLMALVLALFIVELALPFFNRSMGISLSFSSLGKGVVIGGVVLLAILLGLLSGIYPAIYLSGYEPLAGLRGGQLRTRGSVLFRSVMVTLQFTISIAIIVGTLVVTGQLHYLLNKDPGFRDDQIVVIDRINPLGERIEVFCQEARKIPGIISVTNSTTYLGFSNNSSSYQLKGQDRSVNYMFDVNYVDPWFLETYGLELWSDKGRFFSKKDPSDSMCVVLNEAAVREYGFDNPLETVIQIHLDNGSVLEYKVIGVLKDFHHSTLRKKITPYLFFLKTRSHIDPGYISIRFEGGNDSSAESLKKVRELWDDFTLNQPFQYYYLDEELGNYYREEKRTGRITLLFSILAIIIASLGLLGLTIFNTERRLREIAIRKAMGAGIFHLLMIISREVLYLLAISVPLAWLVAFFFMRNWLQVFPYNIGFTPGVYFLAALAAIVITMITVNVITLRAARRNPVDSLYHE